jgi:hypothetical protein
MASSKPMRQRFFAVVLCFEFRTTTVKKVSQFPLKYLQIAKGRIDLPDATTFLWNFECCVLQSFGREIQNI